MSSIKILIKSKPDRMGIIPASSQIGRLQESDPTIPASRWIGLLSKWIRHPSCGILSSRWIGLSLGWIGFAQDCTRIFFKKIVDRVSLMLYIYNYTMAQGSMRQQRKGPLTVLTTA